MFHIKSFLRYTIEYKITMVCFCPHPHPCPNQLPYQGQIRLRTSILVIDINSEYIIVIKALEYVQNCVRDGYRDEQTYGQTDIKYAT